MNKIKPDKSKYIHMRITDQLKSFLQDAADKRGTSLSSFVIYNACIKAERVLGLRYSDYASKKRGKNVTGKKTNFN